MIKTSIIISAHHDLEMFKACVSSVRRHTKTPYEIIVADSGSTEGALDYYIREGLVFISNPGGGTASEACSMALRIANGDALLLLDDDALVARHWLTNLLNCLYSGQDVGIAAPMSNAAGGPQQAEETFADPEAAASHFDSHYQNQRMEAEQLSGPCLLFKREVLRRIGFPDERSPGSRGEEDYCRRARQAGYRLLIAKDTFVFHRGDESLGASPHTTG